MGTRTSMLCQGPGFLAALALATLMACGASPTQAAETILRHDNYLAFNGEAGETAKVAVRSIERPPYQEDARAILLDSASRRVLEQTIPLGTSATLSCPLGKSGLYVLGVTTGQALATVTPQGRPFALIAREQVPLWICGACVRQYFLVPPGLSRVTLFLMADVTGEGARLRVMGPDEAVLLDRTDDFDRNTSVEVAVPPGCDGRPWSFTLDKPEGGKLVLDDVQVYLGRALPPYLCEQPDWLKLFVTAGAVEQITKRLSLPNAALRDGGEVTTRFPLDALPQAKMVVLRAVADDVDYPTEGSFTVNGHGPYTIPETGDAVATLVNIPLKADDLRVGENVLVFKHDNRQSMAMGLTQVELLVGDDIKLAEDW